MGWNYRVLKSFRKDHAGNRHYSVRIVQVYYDHEGQPRNFSELQGALSAPDVAGLTRQLELYRAAAELPVLLVKGNTLEEEKQ